MGILESYFKVLLPLCHVPYKLVTTPFRQICYRSSGIFLSNDPNPHCWRQASYTPTPRFLNPEASRGFRVPSRHRPLRRAPVCSTIGAMSAQASQSPPRPPPGVQPEESVSRRTRGRSRSLERRPFGGNHPPRATNMPGNLPETLSGSPKIPRLLSHGSLPVKKAELA